MEVKSVSRNGGRFFVGITLKVRVEFLSDKTAAKTELKSA